MDEDKKIGMIEIITNLSSTAVKTTKDITALAKAETEWSVRHILAIIFLSSLFRSFLMFTWICICGLFIALLQAKNYSLLHAMLIITGANFILSAAIGLYLLKLKNELAFLPATRRQIKAIFSRKDAIHE